MELAVIGCMVMGVAAAVAWPCVVAGRRRSAAKTRSALSRFAQAWLWQMPTYLGYACPLGFEIAWIPQMDPMVWHGSQLVFVNEHDGCLILDCLVPPPPEESDTASVARQPMTLCAHRLRPLTTDGAVDDLIAWVESGAPVDISLDVERVHISQGSHLVDLALDSTS